MRTARKRGTSSTFGMWSRLTKQAVGANRALLPTGRTARACVLSDKHGVARDSSSPP